MSCWTHIHAGIIKENENMKIEDLQTFEVNGKRCVALVRKLTERECFRLMGVDEAHIDTITSCGVSRSAQYKMAGNSIVAGTGYKDGNGNYDGVLFNIFRKLFVETECENNQMELF